MPVGDGHKNNDGELYPWHAFVRVYENKEDNTSSNRKIWGRKLANYFNSTAKKYHWEYKVIFAYGSDLSTDNKLEKAGNLIMEKNVLDIILNIYNEEEEFENILKDKKNS